jgi:hypothetical protein
MRRIKETARPKDRINRLMLSAWQEVLGKEGGPALPIDPRGPRRAYSAAILRLRRLCPKPIDFANWERAFA